MRNRLPGIVLATLCVAAIAGCTTTSAGTPTPGPLTSSEDTASSAPSDEPPDTGDLPSDGAPKVTNPFDASHFEQNPCDSLTSAQAQGLQVGPGKRSDTNFGRGCSWRNSETNGSVSIDFLSEDKRGLSSAYRSNKNGDFTYFEPIGDVEGQPAVAYDIRSANPTAACTVAVGVTDKLMFATTIGLSANNVGHTDPCDLAATVAGTMVKNMQGGS